MIDAVPRLRATEAPDDARLDGLIGPGIDKVMVVYGPEIEDFGFLFRYEGQWYHGNDACLQLPLVTIGDVRQHLTAPSDCPEAKQPSSTAAALRDSCGAAERPHGARRRRDRRRGGGR